MTPQKSQLLERTMIYLFEAMAEVLPDSHFKCLTHEMLESMILIRHSELQERYFKIANSPCYKSLLKEIFIQSKESSTLVNTSEGGRASEKRQE